MFQCGVFPSHWTLWSGGWQAGELRSDVCSSVGCSLGTQHYGLGVGQEVGQNLGVRRSNKGREPLDPSSWFVM